MFTAKLAGTVLSAPDVPLVLAEWTDPGGGQDPPMYIAPLHVHHEDDEAWYVLDGELTVRAGDKDHHVPAGGAVIVPRGTPHTYWNPSPGPARYLLVMTARIAQLIDALHAMEDPAAEVGYVFTAHRSEYLGWP
jgi:mannose-6-phosphate isomerase-like protein (cupin superfamily)